MTRFTDIHEPLAADTSPTGQDASADTIDMTARLRARRDAATARPVIVRACDVVTTEVDWQWNGRIARKTLAILAGDPGLGKSTIAYDLAARISAGAPMPGEPDGARHLPGGVVVLTAEDSYSMTAVPRLKVHGADLNRVVFLDGVEDEDGDHHVDLARHLPAIDQALADLDNPRLVIIDPLSSYLGKTNTWRDSDARRVLGPLAKLADRRNVAILGLMHLTKDSQRAALYRGQGSIAFVAAARTMLVTGIHPDDHELPKPQARRVVVCVKSNLAPEATALSFHVDGGKIEWGEEVEGAADALLAAPPATRKKRNGKGELVQSAILAELDDGREHRSSDVVANVMKSADAARATVFRVGQVLKETGAIVCRQAGFPAVATWQAAGGGDGETAGEVAPILPAEPDAAGVSMLDVETPARIARELPPAPDPAVVSPRLHAVDPAGASGREPVGVGGQPEVWLHEGVPSVRLTNAVAPGPVRRIDLPPELAGVVTLRPVLEYFHERGRDTAAELAAAASTLKEHIPALARINDMEGRATAWLERQKEARASGS